MAAVSLRLFAVCELHASGFERAATIFSPCPPTRRRPPRPLSRTTAELLAKLGVTVVDFECDGGRWSRVEEAVMAQMIDALKATVEAERTKLLTELSQATEPRLSVIRKEIEACESLLARLARSRAA